MSIRTCQGRLSRERWDFLQAYRRRKCWIRMKTEDPWVVFGSLPCVAFPVLNDALNCHRIDPERQRRRMAEARVVLGIAPSVYEMQTPRGRHSLHEHTARSSSWILDEVRAIQCVDGVLSVTSDACVFGIPATNERNKPHQGAKDVDEQRSQAVAQPQRPMRRKTHAHLACSWTVSTHDRGHRVQNSGPAKKTHE